MILINGWEPYNTSSAIGEEITNYIIFSPDRGKEPRILVMGLKGIYLENEDVHPGYNWHMYWRPMKHATN